MSEYIVDVGDADEEYIEHFGYMATAYADNPIRELIVRCRDCRHYREHKFFKSTLGMGLGTDISDVCMFFSSGVKVEPDGFCAWAERREQ